MYRKKRLCLQGKATINEIPFGLITDARTRLFQFKIVLKNLFTNSGTEDNVLNDVHK